MRIVIIVPDTGEGGLFQFYNQLVPQLALLAEVHVIFASPFHSPHVPSIAGAKCHLLPAEDSAAVMEQLRRGPLVIAPGMARCLSVAHRAWEKALSLEPDCIEVCDWPLSFVPAVIAQSAPCVVQCHGSMGQVAEHDPQPTQGIEPVLIQLVEPQIMAAAQRVQTYSEQNALFWENKTGRRVELIRPAFSLPNLTAETCGVSPRASVFGRLQRWKGPHILCQALRLLGSRAPNVDWYGGVKPWATSGEAADHYLGEQYSDVWGHTFHHHAAVSRQLVAQFQARALFNIVPSTWDVFNFTAVESMAAGRPTIVSTGAGASELIVNGANGFTFNNNDSGSLAAAIDSILSMSEGRRRDVGMAGRETIRLELDPLRIAQQKLASYDDIIQCFGTGPFHRDNSWLTDVLAVPSLHKTDVGEVLGAFPARSLVKHLKDRIVRRLGA